MDSSYRFTEEIKYKLTKELIDYLEKDIPRNKFEMADQIIEIAESVIREEVEKDWRVIRGL